MVQPVACDYFLANHTRIPRIAKAAQHLIFYVCKRAAACKHWSLQEERGRNRLNNTCEDSASFKFICTKSYFDLMVTSHRLEFRCATVCPHFSLLGQKRGFKMLGVIITYRSLNYNDYGSSIICASLLSVCTYVHRSLISLVL